MIFIDISLSFSRLETCIVVLKENAAILDHRVLLHSGATELQFPLSRLSRRFLKKLFTTNCTNTQMTINCYQVVSRAFAPYIAP